MIAAHSFFTRHRQWPAVKSICDKLRQNGYKALLAGGCVRDLLLARTPNDFDVATDATPDMIEGLFSNSVGVGKSFGVIVVPFTDFHVEVATFREDLDYLDGRRPKGVRFATPEKDAKRRDFTVNALFFDPESGEIIDFVGGREDLKLQLIRTVGEPEQRFSEDKLRLMRAVRLSAQLGFRIDEKTMLAIVNLAPTIGQVSRERLRDELFKTLKSERRYDGMKLFCETGILKHAFPVTWQGVEKQTANWLSLFQKSPAGQAVPLATWLSAFLLPAYFHDSFAESEFRSQHVKPLRLDHRLVNEIHFCLRNLASVYAPRSRRRGEVLELLLDGTWPALLALAALAENNPLIQEKITIEPNWLEALTPTAAELRGLTINGGARLLSGRDLLMRGETPGPQLGLLLREAYLLQLEGVLQNHDEAMRWLAECLKNPGRH